MEWGYEEKYDLLGIILKPDFEYDRTEELKPGFIVDIDKNNEICQIEILDWARTFKIPKPQMISMEFDVDIDCGEFCCKVTVNGKLRDEEYKMSGGLFL